MSDAEENPSLPRRESTVRRTARVLSHDGLHKGMNWASIAGVVATAAFTYLADAQRGEADDKLAGGAAQEIAVLQAWKDRAEADIRSQAEQIVRLREAVAALRAVGEATARTAAARRAVEDVGELLAEPAPPPPHPEPAEQPEDRAQGLKRKLLSTE